MSDTLLGVILLAILWMVTDIRNALRTLVAAKR